MCIIYAHNRCITEAENMTDTTGDTMGGASSGVCEPTNHSRLGGGGGFLKRQDLKLTEGDYKAAA